ncbi:MAG: hypothetical protein ACLKAK_01520 [Alkaliphilus sp.]
MLYAFLCAAVYYEIINYRPDSIDVAIPKKKNIMTLPDWPILNLVCFEKERYNLENTKIQDGKDKYQIYNIEKTVIDII